MEKYESPTLGGRLWKMSWRLLAALSARMRGGMKSPPALPRRDATAAASGDAQNRLRAVAGVRMLFPERVFPEDAECSACTAPPCRCC
eukprot:6964704-Alexandrium_andersonii.AAC.1